MTNMKLEGNVLRIPDGWRYTLLTVKVTKISKCKMLIDTDRMF